MFRRTLLGTALAIGMMGIPSAGPAAADGSPPAANAEVREIEEEMAALHERMAELIRIRIEQIHREIAALHEAGHHEEAERLEMDAQRRLEEFRRSFGMLRFDRPEPREEMMEQAGQVFRQFLHLREMDRIEEAEDFLFDVLEDAIDDPRTGELFEHFVKRMHEGGRHEAAEHAEMILADVLADHEEDWGEEDWDDDFDEEEFDLGEVERLAAEISELREAGRNEEAADLQQVLYEMSLEHEELGPYMIDSDWLRELDREIDALHASGRHEEARELERELQERLNRHTEEWERDRAEWHERSDFERRIHHLHAAADNLHHAGFHDQADNLIRHAEEMQHQFHQEHAGHGLPHLEEALPMIMEQIEGLRDEVAELRQIVQRLQRRINAMTPQQTPPARRPGRGRAPAAGGGIGISGSVGIGGRSGPARGAGIGRSTPAPGPVPAAPSAVSHASSAPAPATPPSRSAPPAPPKPKHEYE